MGHARGGIVRLISEKERVGNRVYFKLCSGWLVEPDLVATNAHCLPNGENSKKDTDCVDRLYAISATKEGGRHRWSSCADIITAKEESQRTAGKDYAFFRLKKAIANETFDISTDQLKDKDLVYTHVIQHSSPTKADLFSRQCRTTFRNRYHYYGNRWDSPVLAFLCQNYEGNSGSVITKNDKAVAILSHIAADPNLAISFGTNLSCIRSYPVNAAGVTAYCDQSVVALQSFSLETYFPIDFMLEYSRLLPSEKRGLFGDWMQMEASLTRYLLGLPGCLRLDDPQVASMQKAPAAEAQYPQEMVYRLKLPFYKRMKNHFHDNGEFDGVKVEGLEYRETALYLNLNSLQNSGRGEARVVIESANGGRTIQNDFEMEACPP